MYFSGGKETSLESRKALSIESPDSIGLELSASWPSDLGAFVPTGR